MIKVRVLIEDSISDPMETQINHFLAKMENAELVDIKYCTSDKFASVVIIYKEFEG